MSNDSGISVLSHEPTIFDCPSCHETIDSKAETCRFCGARIDPEAALEAAKTLARINQACSDGSYMRSTAFALPVFFVLRLVPILGGVGTVGFYGLLFIIPVWAIVWWSRFGRIVSGDPDFRRARKTVAFAGIIVAVLLLVFVVGPFILAVIATMQAARG